MPASNKTTQQVEATLNSILRAVVEAKNPDEVRAILMAVAHLVGSTTIMYEMPERFEVLIELSKTLFEGMTEAANDCGEDIDISMVAQKGRA